jgi:hypothetical protein
VALGFVSLATAYVVGMYLLPNQVPAVRVFEFIGYDVERSGYVSEPDRPVTGARRFFVVSGPINPIVRTANAIGALASGLAGCFLGALAYRQGGRE